MADLPTCLFCPVEVCASCSDQWLRLYHSPEDVICSLDCLELHAANPRLVQSVLAAGVGALEWMDSSGCYHLDTDDRSRLIDIIALAALKLQGQAGTQRVEHRLAEVAS